MDIRSFWRVGVFVGGLAGVAILATCSEASPSGARSAGGEQLGLFSEQSDIGVMPAAGPGSAEVHADGKTYISASGANVWANADAFHFVWKKISAGEGTNLSLAADVEFASAAGDVNPHRKGVLMIRQSLDADSAYADACVHGNGLTGIQWRDGKGETTYETQAQANGPKRMRIEKRGDYFSMSFGSSDQDLQPAGGACKVVMSGDFYVGIGVCSHDASRMAKAAFSKMEIAPLPVVVANRTKMISTLETIRVSSKDRRAVYVWTQPQLQRAEAPNWAVDGTLYFNDRGKMFMVKADLPGTEPPGAGAVNGPVVLPSQLDLGILTSINNDHAISWDGKWVAVSDSSQGNKRSAVWVLPIGGASAGAPRRVTENSPSYFHGWSRDDKTLAFCGQRGTNFDIYTVAVEGGAETRLTDSAGKDDGPEYSPDGKFIYFNSDRTGSMQIWRMKADGSEQEQLTKDDLNNWFPHLSPNGEQMFFVTYEKGVVDHPENKDVQLRLMNLRTGAITVLAKLFGGQGTMNVPSWSPDGQYVAFMSYQIVPE